MLKELLGEELAAQVEAKLGDKKLGVINDGTWLPKSKLDEKLETIKVLQEDLNKRDEQLSSLQESVKGNEELTKQIEELQQLNETTKQEFEGKLKETMLNSALKMHYNGKVHDTDLVISLLDKSKIELDENGNIKSGLDEQHTSLLESKSFLFVQDTTPEPVVEDKPQITMSTGNTQPSGDQEQDVWSQIADRYK